MKHDLIFGISHPARRGILNALEQGRKRHGELSRALSHSAPEVARHCNILLSLKLAEKDSRSRYGITTLGRLALGMARECEFLEENHELLNAHDFSLLPEELDLAGALEDCKLLTGTFNVIESMMSVNRNALDYCLCMTEEPADRMVLDHMENLRRGVAVKVILKQDSRLPDEYLSYSGPGMEVRCIGELPAGLAVTDGAALLVPRHERGLLDYGFCAIGSDGIFLRFCNYVFQWAWDNASVLV